MRIIGAAPPGPGHARYPLHFVECERGVLHLEPDVVPMLSGFTVELRIEGPNAHACHLFVLEQFLFRLVVKRPLNIRA